MGPRKTRLALGSIQAILDDMRVRLPRFEAIRRDIHSHPETAYEEFRTARVVADALSGFGMEVAAGIAGTGVVGTLRAGSSDQAIGLRAEMDALALEELNDFAHRSVHAGKMHACGHDGHTATLLAAASYLAEHRRFAGTVYFIFQPAEEGHAGARRMIDEGLFDRFPMQAIFGLHNVPGMALGSFAARTGTMMAGCDSFEIVVRGAGGHGAMPHLAVDPIVASGALIQALQTILTRNKDPMQSAVLSITRIHGGTAFNIIPHEVQLAGTVRFFDQAVQSLIETRMKDIAVLVAQAHGCEAELRYQRLLPATVNSRTEAELCLGALRELAGEDQVDPSPAPMMASEDFAFLLEARPGCYVLAGNGVGKDGCAVHNPNYDFNDQLIPLGAAYWVRLVETALRAPAASHSSAYSRASSQVSVSHSSSASGRPARTKSPNR